MVQNPSPESLAPAAVENAPSGPGATAGGGSKLPTCPRCGTVSTRKYGFTGQGLQRHYCYTCEKTFIDRPYASRKRYPEAVFIRVKALVLTGTSEPQIGRILNTEFKITPSTGTIHKWVKEAKEVKA